MVVFTDKSKFPKGIPDGVIQLKDLKGHVGHHTFSEPLPFVKDAWETLTFHVRTDKEAKKEHMEQIENKYGKDKRRYAAYIFMPISIIWLLGNFVSGNSSQTSLSYANIASNSKGNTSGHVNNQLLQQPVTDYMTSQRDRYIEKMQYNVADLSRCSEYKVLFQETGQRHKSSATGAFTMDMTNLWEEVKKEGCSKKQNLNVASNSSQPINLFSGISNYIHDEVKTIRNANPVHKKVDYKGYQVTYTYQFWKINHQSICKNYRNQLSEYSKCTQAAKRLFTDTCSVLKRTSNSGIKKQQEIMYCDNAQRYKPTVASISWSNTTNISLASKSTHPELEAAREKCNSLITKALISRSEYDVERRDEACKKYRALKNK